MSPCLFTEEQNERPPADNGDAAATGQQDKWI
jgi:hypothetical protein